MNWNAIGAIGEIVGALAVFVTLVYLAKQLRENTASSKVATSWSMMSTFNVTHSQVFASRELAELSIKMFSGDALDSVEAARVNSLVLGHLNGLVAAFEAHREDQLSPLIWERTVRDSIFLTRGSLRPFLIRHLKLVPEDMVSAIFGAAILEEVRKTPLPAIYAP